MTLSKEKSPIPIRNYVKIKVLLHLKSLYDEVISGGLFMGNGYAWRAIADIARATGTSPASLYVIISRWARNHWGYVDAYHFTADQMEDMRPHTLYRINNKGLSYLKRLPAWYPYLAEAKAEVGQIAANESETLNTDKTIDTRWIAWPAYPGSKHEGVTIRWPFQSSRDAHIVFGAGSSTIIVKELTDVINTALHLFRVNPTNECIDSAISWTRYLAKKAGFSISIK